MTSNNNLSGLLSGEHAKLLDVTDRLRELGLARHMPLPQLVVCGDQSSGKSSVLQSISGVKFPVNDGLCTRFATQVILRRSERKSGGVSIKPGDSSSNEQRQKLEAFSAVHVDFENIPTYMEEAKVIMGLVGDSTFSDATLRVEISGPDQPHLTLVDLPGLIHNPDRSQSPRDIKIVKDLVQKYMAEDRTIILAIMSAKSDPAIQEILQMAQEGDKTGRRTMGIITKPDLLHSGSPTEQKVLSYARNEQTKFGLGWHVVRNADYEECKCPTYDRRAKEVELFSKAPWTGLLTTSLGAEALIVRLSECSYNLTRTELPNVVRQIRSRIANCHTQLKLLGPSRNSASEQRRYLTEIAQDFQHIVLDSVDGQLNRNRYSAKPSRSLRAEVRGLTDAFADSMRYCGRTYKVQGTGYSVLFPVDLDADRTRHAYAATDDRPEDIKDGPYLQMIYDEILKFYVGQEFPSTFNPLLVRDLFQRQSRKWEGIALDYADKVFSEARSFVMELFQQHMEGATYENLSEELVEPALSLRRAVLHDKVTELLTPYTRSHPFSKNARFVRELQETQPKILQEYLSWENNDQNDARFNCTKLASWEEAYYKVALDTFVDNMATLAIENCVLADLHELFSPTMVSEMDDETLKRLASESVETLRNRASATKELETFEDALRVCQGRDTGSLSLASSHVMDSYTTTSDQSPSSTPRYFGAGETARAANGIISPTPAIRLLPDDVFDEGSRLTATHLDQRPRKNSAHTQGEHQVRPGSSASMGSNTSALGGRQRYSRTPSPVQSRGASVSPVVSSSSISSPRTPSKTAKIGSEDEEDDL